LPFLRDKECQMVADGTERQTGRETRLLLLVVAVAIAVLLLLAQWQFPGADLSVVSPNAAPLAGLAARATFDEMASTMNDVVSRVSPLTVVVPLVDETSETPPAPGDAPSPADADAPPDVASPAQAVAWAVALRVRRDLALVHVPAGMRIGAGRDAVVETVERDADREMVLIRVAPSSLVPDTLSASIRMFPSFAYAAVVEATPVGPTVQPVFIGRAETVSDPRWSHPLVPAAVARGLVPGSLVFGLNSRFIGMVVGGQDGSMVVPAPALETMVQALELPEGATP
jgi:hypothetical protein